MDIDFKIENNRALLLVGEKTVAEGEIEQGENSWTLLHTMVESDYAGGGAGKVLIEKIYEESKVRGVKLEATCPYGKILLEELLEK